MTVTILVFGIVLVVDTTVVGIESERRVEKIRSLTSKGPREDSAYPSLKLGNSSTPNR